MMHPLELVFHGTTIYGKWELLSHVQFFVTPKTIQSIEFSRPEYWSGYPFPSPGDLPNPGTESRTSALQVDSLPVEPQGKLCAYIYSNWTWNSKTFLIGFLVLPVSLLLETLWEETYKEFWHSSSSLRQRYTSMKNKIN